MGTGDVRGIAAALVALTLGFSVGVGRDVRAAEIVAIGASQTYGKGVPRGSDYPAQLQMLLRARGIELEVKNAGINGATTGKILKNLPKAIDPDTRLVLFQPGSNDRRKGKTEKTEQHIEKIQRKLENKNIRYIMVMSSDYAEYPRSADGLHLTASGYKQLAQKLLPKVLAALK